MEKVKPRTTHDGKGPRRSFCRVVHADLRKAASAGPHKVNISNYHVVDILTSFIFFFKCSELLNVAFAGKHTLISSSKLGSLYITMCNTRYALGTVCAPLYHRRAGQGPGD